MAERASRFRSLLLRGAFVAAAASAVAGVAGYLVYPEIAVGDAPDDWVRALDHDWESVRRAAHRRLTAEGRSSVEPLVRSIASRDDPQYPAFNVLTELYRFGDTATADRVENGLRELMETSPPRVRAQVRNCFNQLRDAREERLTARGRELGAVFRGVPEERPSLVDLRFRPFTAILGPEWTGGDEGLEMLSGLSRLGRLHVVGDAGVSDEALARFEARHPQAEVVRRGPADLGIAGIVGEASAFYLRVTDVDPGSGAERAGVRHRDFVVYVDDVLVESSRDLHAPLVGRQPGEFVRILVRRGTQWLWLDVELGRLDRHGHCRLVGNPSDDEPVELRPRF